MSLMLVVSIPEISRPEADLIGSVPPECSSFSVIHQKVDRSTLLFRTGPLSAKRQELPGVACKVLAGCVVGSARRVGKDGPAM
jgi:hypothetical protein